ncbi:MAG TPA: choice-of-anchor Q domain-containing protein [Thermoanaerobaculaceae bacterium]|nr:choice-of-anchor Q domain-containing protein [Thermoanaerobaculaceae bacterium]
MRRNPVAVLASSGLAALLAGAAHAATFTVTSANDSGLGTLRGQVAAAGDGDTVNFDPSLNGSSIVLTSGEIGINASIAISGPGSVNLGVNANLASRIFEVAAGKTVTISGLLIEGGQVTGGNGGAGGIGGSGGDGQGGGILNHGDLTVTACNFFKNHAIGGVGGAGTGSDSIGGPGGTGKGGAIFNDTGATLQVNDCQFGLDEAVGGTGGDGDGIGGIGGSGAGGDICSQGSMTMTGSLSDFAGCSGGAGGAGTGSSGLGGDGGTANGAALDFAGTANVSASSFTDGTAVGGAGGDGGAGGIPGNGGTAQGGSVAVEFGATVTVSTSAFTSDSAQGGAGSIFGGDAQGGAVITFGQLTLTSSTLSRDTASGGAGGVGAGEGVGGGIGNLGTFSATNVTLSGNSSSGIGGGLASFEPFTLLNCTIAGNQATNQAGGIEALVPNTSNTTLTNSIVAQNIAPAGPDGDVSGGTLASGGHNVIGVAFTPGGGTFTSGAGDQIGTSGTPLDPKLDALANNGGPTQTMALQLTSPALDHGDDAPCPAFDQTTLTSRPQGAHCDAGAFELPTTTGPSGNAFTLTVSKIGLGSGTVSSAPTFGIDCGGACAAAYFGGTSLDLAATAALGSKFVAWGGGCSGTAATAPVVMNSDTTCTAQFDPIPQIPAAGRPGLALLALGLAAAGWLVLRRG